MKKLRILHTSDWHLGRALYGRRRYEEFEAFLNWLAETIAEQQVDVLLLAGDVFDNPNPTTRAQSLYYDFLERVARSPQRIHIVIIAGNHDSPTFLKAPGGLLKFMDIHVVGSVSADGAEEVLILKNQGEEPLLIAAAVPYPRDRDLRDSAPGESLDEKERLLTEAVARHYERTAKVAEELAQGCPSSARPPLVALGHLFAAGGSTVEGDGVRSLYVGSLGGMPASIFPATFDYVALGHLHQPQKVGGQERIRYSGAPLAMTFAEAHRPKSVTLIDFNQGQPPEISQVAVPVFQRLEKISGDWAAITSALEKLIEQKAQAWLEVEYDSPEIIGDLRQRLADLVEGSGLEILLVKNCRQAAQILERYHSQETLTELSEEEVFRRLLVASQTPDADQAELLATYGLLLQSMAEASR